MSGADAGLKQTDRAAASESGQRSTPKTVRASIIGMVPSPARAVAPSLREQGRHDLDARRAQQRPRIRREPRSGRRQPLDRLDLPEVLGFVRDKRWFVLHAPRQTGKTTALLALRDRLAGDGYRCVYANVEVGQAGREDTARAMQAILGAMASRAWSASDRFLDEVWSDLLARYGPDGALREALTRWSAADPRPLLRAQEDRYADHGVFGRGQHARSACLPDCSLDVTSLFDAQ